MDTFSGLNYAVLFPSTASKLQQNTGQHYSAIRKPVLVTGATGFIGAHIVDNLLARGFKVRGTTRSLAKSQQMVDARPQHKGNLEFVQIEDFEKSADFTDAVRGTGAVIHTASVRTSTLPIRTIADHPAQPAFKLRCKGQREGAHPPSYPRRPRHSRGCGIQPRSHPRRHHLLIRLRPRREQKGASLLYIHRRGLEPHDLRRVHRQSGAGLPRLPRF